MGESGQMVLEKVKWTNFEKIWTSKFSGSRVIVAKIADVGPPGAPQKFVSGKNPPI